MTLVDLLRREESCEMTFSDEATFNVDYLNLRLNCPCANCKPRRENNQRMLEFKQEIARLRIGETKRGGSRSLWLEVPLAFWLLKWYF